MPKYFLSNDNAYRTIKARAKKFGAKKVDVNHAWHMASFEHCKVYFLFKPFRWDIQVYSSASGQHISSINAVEELKKELDTILAFLESIKQFDEPVEED